MSWMKPESREESVKIGTVVLMFWFFLNLMTPAFVDLIR